MAMDEIVAAIAKLLSVSAGPLAGTRALVTAGPTREPIDPVRFIANRSSGKQGYAIAAALATVLLAATLLVYALAQRYTQEDRDLDEER